MLRLSPPSPHDRDSPALHGVPGPAGALDDRRPRPPRVDRSAAARPPDPRTPRSRVRWRRRTTYVVDVSDPDACSPTAVHAFYRETLTTLRGEAGRVVADLLSRREPLPPAAKQAAVTLQRLTRADVFATVDRNPFQQVRINHADDEQWQALLVLAPYSPDLRLEGEALFSDLFASEGSMESVRLRLRPDQLARVNERLAAAEDVPRRLQLQPRKDRHRARPP